MFEMLLARKKTGPYNPIVTLPLPPSDARGYGKAMLMNEAGTSIYVAGGNNASSAITNTMYRYDIAEGTWTLLAPIPATVTNTVYGNLAQSGDKLYYFRSRNILEYTISTNTWITKSALPANSPIALYGAVLNWYNGKLYTVRYSEGDYPSGTRLVEYNPVTNAVTARGLFTTTLMTYLGGCVVDNKLYMTHSATRTTGMLSVCDLNTFVWSDTPVQGTNPTTSAVASVKVGDKIYIITGPNKVVTSYTPAGHVFESLSPLVTAFTSQNQAVGSGNNIYLLSPTEFVRYGI